MKMFPKSDKRKNKPAEEVNVSEKHIWLRIILFAVCLLVAVAAMSAGVTGLINKDTGWQQVTVKSSDNPNCSADFSFTYNFGSSGFAATKEYRKVTELYTSLSEEAFRLFHESEQFDGTANIAYLNEHPNEPIKLDVKLYTALEKAASCGRYLYCEPVYEYYRSMFSCNYDYEIYDFDALTNPELAAEFSEILSFVTDAADIDLQFGEDNTVVLRVSDEYIGFAKTHDIYCFTGLGVMKNAFIIDYLADGMTDGGYTSGYINSADGYCRNMLTDCTQFSLNLFDMNDNTVNLIGTMHYTAPSSIVSLRSYPIDRSAKAMYYISEDGRIRSPFIDMADGISRTSVNDLTSYSKTEGCANILIKILPAFIGDTFDARMIKSDDLIESIWCEDGILYYTDENIEMTGLTYRAELVR